MLKKLPLFLLLSLLVAGCSQNLYTKGRNLVNRGEYDRAIDNFQQEIQSHPKNVEAWRELGIAQYKKGEFEEAEKTLIQANQVKSDPAAYLYLGMIFEQNNKYDSAIEFYTTALSLEPEGEIRSLVRAHIDRLMSQKIKEETDLALKNESKIEVSSIPQNTIAVVNFDGSHLPPDIAPISAGLAEFTSIDLAKVKSLRVVERLKIDAIMNELKLETSEYADPKSAPRMGRLIGSRRIVTGSLLGVGKKAVRLDGAIVNTTDSSSKTTAPAEGELKKFFKMEKDFVFKIIDELGISLSQEEKDAIRKVPTESYLAFIAYSRGVDYRGRGMTTEARKEFNRAVQTDGNFHEARSQATALSQASTTETGKENSVKQFESEIRDERTTAESGAGLGGQLSSVVQNSGVIPNVSTGGTALSPEGAINTHGTGTVVIRGNPDAD